MMTNKEYLDHLAELQKWKHAAYQLRDAYHRLRALIPGALNTPRASSSQEVWETTERALRNLLARLETKEPSNV